MMTKITDKANALKILQESPSPLSLKTLLNKLGQNYAERTVRRWLSEWVKNGILIKEGHKRSTQYLYAKNELLGEHEFHFSPASQNTINQIKKPYELRKPTTYQPAWLAEYRPNIDFFLSPSQISVLTETGSRAKKYKSAGTYARHIYNRVLIDLSYNSSRLEGNTYTLLETEKLILEGKPSLERLDEEKTMILNHKEAIRFLVEKSDQQHLDETIICTLHYLLSDGLVSPEYAGKVRDYGVRIQGSVYIPSENPHALRTHLINICKKYNLIENPFEKSIFLLAHIAYLQPFVDVNKRTARLSANFPLFNANVVPLSFDAISQSDYIDAMISIYELNDIRPLVDLYLYSYQRTAEKYDVTIEAIGFDRIRVQYRQQRRDIIRNLILNKLHGKKLEEYIKKEANALIEPDDREQFIWNIREDLEQLGPQSIIGMGITNEQADSWRNNKK